MVRKRFPDTHCSVARALNDVGDWWSLLVVKEAMLGTRRFVDFQQNLGIARNILCDRLARLLENGVLIKQDVGEHGTRYEYRLTEKGRDLFTVVTALRQWSDRWNGESDGPELVDRANGEPVRTVAVQSRDGRALDVRAVVYRDSSDTDSAAGCSSSSMRRAFQ